MLGLLLETEVEDEEETEVLFTEAANASPYLSTLTADDVKMLMLRRFPVDLSVPAPPKLPRDVCGQPRPGCALWQAVCRARDRVGER